MAIGGFDGQGGNLTLAQFKAYVAKHEIHYYIAGSTRGGGGGSGAGGARPTGGGRPPGAGSFPGSPGGGQPGGAGFSGRAGPGGPGGPGGSSTSAITTWVKAHYKAVTIGGQTVYDLTQPLG